MSWERDGVEAGGDIPPKEVLCFDKTALCGEFVTTEGVRVGVGIGWCNGSLDEEGRERGDGLGAVHNLGGIEGDRGLVVDETVGRDKSRGGNQGYKGTTMG